MGLPGFWEIIAIIAVIFFVFGAKRLPDIARSLGKGVQEFKKSKDDAETQIVENEKEIGNKSDRVS